MDLATVTLHITSIHQHSQLSLGRLRAAVLPYHRRQSHNNRSSSNSHHLLNHIWSTLLVT